MRCPPFVGLGRAGGVVGSPTAVAFCRTPLTRINGDTILPFWVVLAVVFLGRSVFTRDLRRKFNPEYIKWAVQENTPLTVAGLGKAIDHILAIEMVGFAAAALAAIISAVA
jgi:hypothetical protein